MANVFDVANFFIKACTSVPEDYITNLKLNKLLYFAQGECIARTGKALFPDQLEAWQYGPVVECVYQKYKKYSYLPIDSSDASYSDDAFTEDEFDLLLDVLREYGKYQPSYLVSLTHQADTPWSKHYNEYIRNNPIPLSDIEEYFSNCKIPRFDDIVSLVDPIECRRDADGYLVLPNDLDDDDDDWSEYAE